MEEQIDTKRKFDLEKLHDQLVPRIKKRLKMKDIESKLLTKTNVVEFNKTRQHLDDKITMVVDRVDREIPYMEQKVFRAMKNKAEISDVEKLSETKVDKIIVDQLVDRINKIEEDIVARAKKME